MVIDLKAESGKVKNNLNIYALYILIIFAVVTLLIISGSKIFGNITKKRQEIVSLESEVSKLNVKIDALKSINKEDYADVSILSVVFPEDDPLLFAYSQLNELALRNAVFIFDVNFEQDISDSQSISKGQLNFYAAGPRDKVIDFFSELTKDAPLSGFDNLSFQKYPSVSDIFSVNATVDYYYSPYAKEITSIEGSVVPLSENEKAAYESLIKLKVLSSRDIKPQPPSTEKIDPFAETASVGISPPVTPEITPEVTPEITPGVTPLITP
jgi:outer membrane murein-binding lipoprotein Lpp